MVANPGVSILDLTLRGGRREPAGLAGRFYDSISDSPLYPRSRFRRIEAEVSVMRGHVRDTATNQELL